MSGPRKYLTALDKKMLDKAYTQGGVLNFLGKQPEVTAPIRSQSHADSPPTQLAYITDAEKDLLVKANLHDSMDGKPNRGPAGLESLDDSGVGSGFLDTNVTGSGWSPGGGNAADKGIQKYVAPKIVDHHPGTGGSSSGSSIGSIGQTIHNVTNQPKQPDPVEPYQYSYSYNPKPDTVVQPPKFHKFEDKLKDLYDKGLGNSQAAQVFKNYLAGITAERREELGLQSQMEANKYIQGNVGSQEQDYIKSLGDSITMGGIDLSKYGVTSFADLQGPKGESIWKAIQASPEWQAMGPQQQYAVTRKAQGVIAGGSLSGAGSLFKLSDAERWSMGLPDDTDTLSHYYSTYMDPQQQAYDPSGYISIAGNEGIPAYTGRNIYGDLIKNKEAGANVYSPSWDYSSMGWDSSQNDQGAWGSGWGHGGNGGGGGSGGFGYNEYAQQGIAQGPGVNPGSLQEQVNQGFLSGMGAPRFSRGGIVSLLRLGE
jgi:hypothetical protein